MRYHFTEVRMVDIKKSTNNKCWEGCGEKGTLLREFGGNVNWYNHYREQYGGLKKTKNRATYMILKSHSWTWIWRKLYLEKIHAPPVFTAVLFTIAKTWKQFHLEAIQMSIDR